MKNDPFSAPSRLKKALAHFKCAPAICALTRLAQDQAVEVRSSAEYALVEMLDKEQ
jgi:hypothetical protein